MLGDPQADPVDVGLQRRIVQYRGFLQQDGRGVATDDQFFVGAFLTHIGQVLTGAGQLAQVDALDLDAFQPLAGAEADQYAQQQRAV